MIDQVQMVNEPGVSFEFVNFDDIFKSTSKGSKVVVNDLDVFSEESKELMDKYIYKNYSEDNISLIPSCTCGELSGELYVGKQCTACGTHVRLDIDESVSFLLYMRRPKGVSKIISPIIMTHLLNRYKTSNPSIQVVRYIIDPTWRSKRVVSVATRARLDYLDRTLVELGIEKSYNGFVDNFFTVLDILENDFTTIPKKERGKFPDALRKVEDKIFSDYLPFVNNTLLVMNSESLGRFIDTNISKVVNCIRRVTGIDVKNKNLRTKQIQTAKTIIELSEYYSKYFSDSIYPKPGLIRKHLTSTRSHFTARAVVTSIPTPHRYDEIYIPWTIGVTLLRPYIIKELKKLKGEEAMSHKEIVKFLSEHSRQYHPLIDKIFCDMISHVDGIECLFNRNPSLHRGSIETVRIRKVKTDPKDLTFSMSYLISPAFNGDFDGDSFNLTLALTKNVVDQLDNFDPHHSLLALSGPNDFSSNIKFPKTVTSNLANWFNS